ncbi:MAG: hypothetical protein ACRDR6_13890 [Pseudonocardiaceae bacterium]
MAERLEASLGLSLTEAHALLGSVQDVVVSAQTAAAVAEQPGGECAETFADLVI